MPSEITPSLANLRAAADIVHSVVQPTPQRCWPLLSTRCGCEVWVKHENHTAIGAFKLRGGLVYLRDVAQHAPQTKQVFCATRGNHGQSVAFAAAREQIQATIFVPEGNSQEKNTAMRALGARLVVTGHDFQAALEVAQAEAQAANARLIPAFHPLLVAGVASYALELFSAHHDLDTMYVPIGLGSGICGVIVARDALGLRTEIVGVVADGAPCYALSVAQRAPVSTTRAETIADGLACRTPVPEAVEVIAAHAARIVRVSDEQIAAAMRVYFTDTHNIAEGAGAAALAALLTERERLRGRKVGLVLSGGNVDLSLYRRVLDG